MANNRTVAQSIVEVRKYLMDDNGTVANEEYTDENIFDKQKIAAQTLWDLTVEHQTGRRHLRTVQSPQSFIAYVNTYELPSDARRIEKIEYRSRTTLDCVMTSGTVTETTPANWPTDGSATVYIDDKSYNLTGIDASGDASMTAVAATIQTALQAATGSSHTVTYDTSNNTFIISGYSNQRPWKAHVDGTGTDISSSSFMNAVASAVSVSNTSSREQWVDMIYSHHGNSRPESGVDALFGQPTGHPYAWYDDTEEGYIRMSPTPTQVNSLYRVWYYREPIAPAVTFTAGAINTGGDLFWDTKQPTDLLIEYYTAALLLNEELENRDALGHFAGLFSQQFALFAESRGAGSIKPQRSYIKRRGH